MSKLSARYYKQTAPTKRILYDENSFEKGMHWTDSAISPGYVHTLLNYEIDNLSYDVKVSEGYQVQEVSFGNCFQDRAIFGSDSRKIYVFQTRNDYNLRAFEGVTNIISVNKVTVQNNQDLEEKLRQQNYEPEEVSCYKVLTYNPTNHRLMSVTLVKAKRDKYFSIMYDDSGSDVALENPNIRLCRLNSNPISCGFSEIWQTQTGEAYITNCTDEHPNGIEDIYTPRERRNRFDKTFGQNLHNPLHMQTIPVCEGYGNKTFCFTKKKLTDLEGPTRLSVNAQYIPVVEISSWSIRGGGSGYAVGDKIVFTTPDPDLTIAPAVLTIQRIGSLTDIRVYSPTRGTFKGLVEDYNSESFEMRVYDSQGNDKTEQVIPAELSPRTLSQHYILDGTILQYLYDIYLNNMVTDTGYYTVYLNGKLVPLDAFWYGKLLTPVVLCAQDPTITTRTIIQGDLTKLWDDALITQSGLNSEANALFNLNLEDGTLSPSDYAQQHPSAIRLFNIGYLTRNAALNHNLPELFAIFTNPANLSATWGSQTIQVHPSEWLTNAQKQNIRKGQGFRIAAHCISQKTSKRFIKTLRPEMLTYYSQHEVDAVFVLDYVWNGSSWDFSFIDTSVDMYDANDNELSLVENWDTNGQDGYGNTITRHYTQSNCLTYLDVLTKNNQDKQTKHIVDSFSYIKQIWKEDPQSWAGGGTTYESNTLGYLTQNLDETIEDNMHIDGMSNKSKLNDTSYACFEVTPKELSPGEAARWGYNMLSNTPYSFICQNTSGTGSAYFTGILLKDAKDLSKVLLNPKINTKGVLEIYYNADFSAFSTVPEGINYQLTVDYKNPIDDWRPLKKFTVEATHSLLATGNPIQIPFTGVDESTLIRATLTNLAIKEVVPSEDNTTTVEEYLVVDQTITTLSFAKDSMKVGISPEIYDLGSATGITYWKERLVLSGVMNAENMLFLSEPNSPDYFAYPNGVDIFEENIVHVLPYSDALLVFTNSKLWRIDLNADGLSWKKTLLQQNLRFEDQDIPYITTIKSMLFFKSGTQFYMLVPTKLSTVGELTIAPISKPIKEFLLNPFVAIRDLVHPVYPDLAGQEYSSPLVGTLNNSEEIIEVPERPITDYLVKYGAHTEQDKVVVDWWFDISDWKNQVADISNKTIQHDLVVGGNDREYWLVQLIYDTLTYSWCLQTHTTNHIGVFLTSAIEQNVELINLVQARPGSFLGGSYFNNDHEVFGLTISHKIGINDFYLKHAGFGTYGNLRGSSGTYPRFQILDTGYKEVFKPALKKRFREVQFMFEPNSNTSVGLSAVYVAMIDGHTVMSAVSQEVYEETEIDPITGTHIIIKIVDRLNFHDDNLLDPNAPINYVPLPYTVNGQLSNTFVLDSSAMTGVKQVKIRRQINGKGYLARTRFTNITHASYTVAGYSFVFHYKNAR